MRWPRKHAAPVAGLVGLLPVPAAAPAQEDMRFTLDGAGRSCT